MDAFLRRRTEDPRYAQSERRVEAVISATHSSAWYEAPQRAEKTKPPALSVVRHEASATKEYASETKNAPKKERKEKSEKKRKKNADGSDTSDGSDSGPCWSDYERTPGTKEGEKGSCRPKGSKKSKSD